MENIDIQEHQVSIVIPLYNESEVFPHLIKRINDVIENNDLQIEVVLVDDGSKDETASLMHQIALQDQKYHCVFLSRNFGHQNALLAGLKTALGQEAVFILDADLQDPPELLPEFYKKLKQGYDVVYGIRKNRKSGLFRKLSYFFFYRLLNSISNTHLPIDSGDFSLISRRVVNILNQMPEESLYIRGLRSWIGFEQTGIEYDRQKRHAGKSKYSIKKMFQLAFNGIFNFSEIPIKFITRLGLSVIIISMIYFAWTIVRKLVFNDVPSGFTALLAVIILFSGVQLTALGIIGEYITRIFFQSKKRPLFVIRKEIINKSEVANK